MVEKREFNELILFEVFFLHARLKVINELIWIYFTQNSPQYL